MIGRTAYRIVLACSVGTVGIQLGQDTMPARGAQPSEPAARQSQDGTLLTDDELRYWTTALESPQYSVRSAATDRLMDLSAEQVPTFAALIRDGSLETVQRGTLVLQQLALSGGTGPQRAARDVLEVLSQPGPSLLAQRARESLRAIAREQRHRAVNRFTAAGAQYQSQMFNSMGLGDGAVQTWTTLRFGRTWRGNKDLLELLTWVTDVDRIVLEGPQVTDEWIPHVARLPRLASLSIRKANLSDGGLAPLQHASSLRNLEIYYVPLTNQVVPHFEKIKLERLVMYGNNLTKDQSESLKEATGTKEVDLRPGGGFLGVSQPQPGARAPQNPGCLVAAVVPNTAAERAGMRANDVIIKFNGVEVHSFVQMTGLIGEQRAGDKVQVDILRDQQPMTVEVTLGEWIER